MQSFLVKLPQPELFEVEVQSSDCLNVTLGYNDASYPISIWDKLLGFNVVCDLKYRTQRQVQEKVWQDHYRMNDVHLQFSL